MNKGFTLIELSIVLVIIGLLTAGILVGQSLIQSARISSEVRRLQQYSIAIVNFKQKFKQEAGDSNMFTPQGNANFESYDLIDASGPYHELQAAWTHLSQAGMISEKYVWDETKLVAGVGDRTIGAVSPKYSDVPPNNNGYYNMQYSISYRDGRFAPNGTRYFRDIRTVYDPYMLWGIENKIDDGVPDNGDVNGNNTGAIWSLFPTTSLPCTPANLEITTGYKYCVTRIYFSPTLEMPIMAN